MQLAPGIIVKLGHETVKTTSTDNKFGFSDDIVSFLRGVEWDESRTIDVAYIKAFYINHGFLWDSFVEEFLSSFLDMAFTFALETGIVLPITFYQIDLLHEAIGTVINMQTHYNMNFARIAVIDRFLEEVFIAADHTIYLVTDSYILRADCLEAFFQYLVNQHPMERLL